MRYQKGIYKGEWKNNKAQGNGEIIFKNGSRFIGEMHEDCWHGKGCFIYNDGKMYKGNFKNGKQHGYGEITFSNSLCSYKGYFKDNCPHGHGIVVFKSGYKYVGKMKKGKRNGFGEIYDPDNNLYLSGNFTDGKLLLDDLENLTDPIQH